MSGDATEAKPGGYICWADWKRDSDGDSDRSAVCEVCEVLAIVLTSLIIPGWYVLSL
jgi:hypothetical protein